MFSQRTAWASDSRIFFGVRGFPHCFIDQRVHTVLQCSLEPFMSRRETEAQGTSLLVCLMLLGAGM